VLRIILPHLSFHDQHRLGLTCRTLYHTAATNCRAKLSFHRRRLAQSDFELAQRSSNSQSWAFYRGLVWLNEDMSKVKTRSQRLAAHQMGPASILAKAELYEEQILSFGIAGDGYTWYPDQMFTGFNGVYKSLYTRHNSPDWRVVLNHRNPEKSQIVRLATGRAQFRQERFIRTDFKYAGFHSIFFIDGNYATTLVKHSLNDIQWEPGDPSDDLLVLRLDTGTYDVIDSIEIERLAKAWLNESWNVLGDVYLDAFHHRGSHLLFEVQLFILDYNRSIVLNASLEYYPDRVKDKLIVRRIEQDEINPTVNLSLAGVEQV